MQSQQSFSSCHGSPPFVNQHPWVLIPPELLLSSNIGAERCKNQISPPKSLKVSPQKQMWLAAGCQLHWRAKRRRITAAANAGGALQNAPYPQTAASISDKTPSG
jgi:hypothetical protein